MKNNIKSGLAFSFCFSFTDFQLKTVSKAFHITYRVLPMVAKYKPRFRSMCPAAFGNTMLAVRGG
jgi:hypothetical protein